jgi:hypothetical protein
LKAPFPGSPRARWGGGAREPREQLRWPEAAARGGKGKKKALWPVGSWVAGGAPAAALFNSWLDGDGDGDVAA